MKVSKKKKNERLKFAREHKKCPRCGNSIAEGGHYVPALDAWTCDLVDLLFPESNDQVEPPETSKQT